MAIAPSLIEGVVGGAKFIESLVNNDKAKKEAAKLKASRPKLGRDALADENLAFAKSELANGMSAKAEKAYNDIADRDFSSSLSSILKGGGNLNSIGDIYGSKEQGRQNLALMKDQLRLNQINNEVRASQAVSERNDQQFQFNEWMPWADDAQANAQARQGAQAGIWNGLQTAGGAAMQYGQNKHEENMFAMKNGNYQDNSSTPSMTRVGGAVDGYQPSVPQGTLKPNPVSQIPYYLQAANYGTGNSGNLDFSNFWNR